MRGTSGTITAATKPDITREARSLAGRAFAFLAREQFAERRSAVSLQELAPRQLEGQ